MIEIAKKIRQAGGNLYLVGGAIRNKLLNLPITDEDYCVTGISKEQFTSIFPEAKIQGKDFPVFILNNKEIALARIERKTGIGHKEFEFNTSPNITIEEDLARRDLTINSIAQDVLTGEIIDPFKGMQDIQNRILRKTTNAFSEDPLRVYRVARFMAVLNGMLQQPINYKTQENNDTDKIIQLYNDEKIKENKNEKVKNVSFTIESETIKAMNSLRQELTSLSKERVFGEFRKALSSNKPSLFFEALKQADVLDVHFKEIANLIGQTQPIEYHPEGDSYNHTMIVEDNSTKLTQDLSIRFSCLVHDLGKGITPKDMLPHHYGHDEAGIKLISDLGNRIGVPNAWIKCGKTASKWHMRAGIFEKMTPKKQVDLIENVGKSMLGLNGLKIVVACDRNRENENLQETFNKIEFAKIGKKCLEQVNGDTIKEKYQNLEGEALGKKLHEERIIWLKHLQRN